MLETEDVDDDYFTPTASTSLANIFSSLVGKDENESLKYTAPKPQIAANKPEVKSTACVFACALQGYEWFNNIYTPRGKLGFAVVKILKSGQHNIILYDSNKTTLSSALVTHKLEVSLKGQNYICYYDDQRKYWSLYGSNEEIQKILELFKEFDVVIKASSQTEDIPPEVPDTNSSSHKSDESIKKHSVDSDIDLVNVKEKKADIINRMASMGHSVLPHTGTVIKSTDTEDSDLDTKPIKHKSNKGFVKKGFNNRNFETHKKVEAAEHSTEIEKIQAYNIHDHQMMTLPGTSIITSPSNEMNLFVTEQRISNTELRMNMNRLTDKVDQVLNKMTDLQTKDNSNINTEIMQKLLKEYERKIKVYEDLLNKDVGTSKQSPLNTGKDDDRMALKSRLTDLENIIKEKNDYVLSLKNEIQSLKDKNDSKSEQNKCLVDLEKELVTKNDNISQLSKEIEDLTNNIKKDLETKIKSIMNETFQAISNNFDNDETYSGESIKNLIANVIKQVTVKMLNE